MKIDTNLFHCTACFPCGGKKYESDIFPGKKFPSKQACEEAEKKNPPFPKPKP